ncbi:helix-turn-helix domain-containing protein [Kaistia sp. MMO-174]|uniref:helix-turn-helix domain-containing protein n=1 Tax=Kaistia sp. MMO-174 TaxID=3081256 RepID=UPI00301781ED
MRIKEIRNLRGLTQQEVADRIGVHLTNYNKIENGQSDPPLSRFQRIAEILNCRIEDLFADNSDLGRRVDVVTTVEAGAWSEGLDLSGEGETVTIPNLPAWLGLTLRAAIVRGDSMNRRYSDGSTIVFNDLYETGERLIPNAAYVVQRARHGEYERTCKVLHKRGDGSLWLVPDSLDPTFEAFQAAPRGQDDEISILGRVVWSSRVEPAGEQITGPTD